MSLKQTFLATVEEDLSLRFINPARFKQHLLPLKSQIVEITAEKQHKHRTNEQNRYYRGVVLKLIAEHCGYRGNEELDSLHNELKRMFLPLTGILKLPGSTSKLNTVEMSEYVENVRRWAASEYGIYIPEPNEVTTE